MRIGGSTFFNPFLSSNNKLEKTVAKLSSGLSINTAADDAAGMAVAQKLEAQIRGSKQAFFNAQYGISMVYIAEGAMQQTSSILQRMRELAVQSANGVLSETDRSYVELEVEELKGELDRITNVTESNGRKMLREGLNITLQIGANEGDELRLSFMNASSSKLGLEDTSLATRGQASKAITAIDSAIDAVSMNRAQLGGNRKSLERACDMLGNYIGNLTEAESRITDADMAKEILNFTKFKILEQAKTAIASQANQIPGVVLSLLQD